MRSPHDQEIALQCVNLAGGNLSQAKRIMDFVTGEEQDDAKRKLDAVRAVITGSDCPE